MALISELLFLNKIKKNKNIVIIQLSIILQNTNILTLEFLCLVVSKVKFYQ